MLPGHREDIGGWQGFARDETVDTSGRRPKGIYARFLHLPSVNSRHHENKNPDVASEDIRRPPGAIRRTHMHQAGSKPSERLCQELTAVSIIFRHRATATSLPNCRKPAAKVPTMIVLHQQCYQSGTYLHQL
ncbi:hypothetical protein BN1723_006692 [Verticillium longisporum]|uniref:Uncharacterized protein n=1 Tax=Verticillium longisporum TaxID=100787 RepID=A0A0G4NGU5_VERLO|nr:hypothetical protein BN1723_006692 [Verticillium longisporum]